MNLTEFISLSRKPQLVVLVDPDKFNPLLIEKADKSAVSFFLVGGSKLKKNNLSKTISEIKKRSKKPVFIFPGDETQISKNADGLLLLSLISGRNAEYLIGKHVKSASFIKKNKIQTLSTGYILIDGQKKSTTQKITKTKALKPNQIKTIVNTALAGEQLGLQAIYLEAGSGAKTEVNSKIIKAVKSNINLPLFVGGGINSYQKAKKALESGANFVVIGNSLEKNLHLLFEIEKAFV
jgi:phosphoglycerol geranylgeranyltransferase